jgi:uncharacterized membrane protein YczE
MIRSEFGLGPWDAFHVGLHRLTGMSAGVASIVVGIAIVAGTWSIGVRPGAGTLADMVLIGVFIDLLLPALPPATGWLRPAYHAAGTLLTGFATGLCIAPGLGKGPRDGMMLGIAARTGWSVRRVRTAIELTVLALGWTLGGTVGLGTIVFALGIGPATRTDPLPEAQAGRETHVMPALTAPTAPPPPPSAGTPRRRRQRPCGRAGR